MTHTSSLGAMRTVSVAESEVDVLADVSASASEVTEHYSSRGETGRGARSLGDAETLRRLNNWVKSVLIQNFCLNSSLPFILDICGGKGGDLNKWEAQNIALLVLADGARESVVQATERVRKIKPSFPCRFVAADCFRVRLSSIPRLYAPRLQFDLVSCQFALHYSFETEDRARALLVNVAERLKPDGFFIGTIPDANVLVRKARESGGKFGNDKYEVKFEGDLNFDADKPFGIKYWFRLNQAVDDCHEYLVHFPTFQALALEYGLELVLKQNFHKFIVNNLNDQTIRLIDILNVFQKGVTVQASEWEITYVYMAFAFRKKSREAPLLDFEKNDLVLEANRDGPMFFDVSGI